MKKAYLSASMISIAILGGCGDDSGSSASTTVMPDGVVKTIAELEKCNSSIKGVVQQVLATGSYYRCEDNEWVDLGWEKELTASSSSSRSESGNTSSSKVIFNEKDAIETPASCSSSIEEESSSSIEEESSSSEIEEESSSSEELIESSSSEAEEESSSSEEEEDSSSSEAEEESSSSVEDEEESSSSFEVDDN